MTGDQVTARVSYNFAVGDTDVECTATDATQTATISFTVTVLDAEAPEITCPTDLVVSNELGQCQAVVNFSVTATDNCSTPSVVSVPP